MLTKGCSISSDSILRPSGSLQSEGLDFNKIVEIGAALVMSRTPIAALTSLHLLRRPCTACTQNHTRIVFLNCAVTKFFSWRRMLRQNS